MKPHLLRSQTKARRLEIHLLLGSGLVIGTVSGAQAQVLANTLKRQNLSEVVVTATPSATECSRGKWSKCVSTFSY
ncbi:MAG: hypothetical protein ACRYFX_13015 [Janthinobacterium lividum]